MAINMATFIDKSSIEIDGVDPKDYPDFCDAYVSYAEWPSGRPLTDEQLDALNESVPELAQQLVFELLL